MGFFDYLLFGALINNLRKNIGFNKTHSKLPTDRFNLIYEDGYADCCMNYDEYGSHDDDSFGYDIDCIDDCNDDSFREY